MHARAQSIPIALAACLVAAGLALVLAQGCAKSAPEEVAPTAAPVSAGPAAEAAEAGDAAAADTIPAREWDQERMTQLTGDLAKAMLAVRNSFRNDPVMQSPDVGMRRSAEQMGEILRNLDRNCRSLATQVERGGTADETRGTARRIGSLLRDANMVGKRLTTSEWTDERIRPAMELINEIAPYYGRGPLYDAERMEMLDTGPNPNRRQPGE